MIHKFVEFIPDTIDEEVIYISMEFSTAVHKCVCGCGNEVVTPFSPMDWSLIFNGESVSLYPSIGNWSFNCQSHYWIKKGKVVHCRKWKPSKVKSERRKDRKKKKRYFKTK